MHGFRDSADKSKHEDASARGRSHEAMKSVANIGKLLLLVPRAEPDERAARREADASVPQKC